MSLRKTLIAVAAVAGLALVGVAGGSKLTPIRECANFVPTGQAHGTWAGYWTYADPWLHAGLQPDHPRRRLFGRAPVLALRDPAWQPPLSPLLVPVDT